MSTDGSLRKLIPGPVAALPRRVPIGLRVSPARATKGETAGDADLLAETLAPLLERGFPGAERVRFDLCAAAPDRIEVALSGAVLPRDLMAFALLGLLVPVPDARPADGSEAAALIGQGMRRGGWIGEAPPHGAFAGGAACLVTALDRAAALLGRAIRRCWWWPTATPAGTGSARFSTSGDSSARRRPTASSPARRGAVPARQSARQ